VFLRKTLVLTQRQADVNFFTTPDTNASVRRPSSPSKPKTQPAAIAPPQPSDLVTPKSFAESSRRHPPSKPPQVMDGQPSMKDPPADLVVPREVGHKRRLDEEMSREPSSSRSHEPRMMQPLPKRIKKEKGSIFIPKKNKVILFEVFVFSCSSSVSFLPAGKTIGVDHMVLPHTSSDRHPHFRRTHCICKITIYQIIIIPSRVVVPTDPAQTVV